MPKDKAVVCDGGVSEVKQYHVYVKIMGDHMGVGGHAKMLQGGRVACP